MARFSAAIRDALRVHARTIVPVGALVATGAVLYLVLLGLYALLVGVRVYESALASPDPMAPAVIGLMVFPTLLAVAAALTWAGSAARAASAAVDARRTSMPLAALHSLRDVPRAVGVIAVTFAAVLAAVVLTPVLVVLGVVGLLTRSTRRPRADVIAMAIPFGVAVVVLTRWSLALQSVWLAGNGVRAAIADSAARVRGRGVVVAASLLAALVVSGLATAFLTVQNAFGFVVTLVVVILIGGLPTTVATVLYRHELRTPRQPAPSSARVKVAAVLTFTLVLPLAIGSVPPAAQAAGGPGAVSFTISADANPVLENTPTTVRFAVHNALTVEGTQPSGDIEITIDGSPVPGPHTLSPNGNVELSRSFTAGDHTVAASYPGDASYEAKTASLIVRAGAATVTSLSSSEPFATYGTAFTLEAGVSGGGTGTVEFYANGGSGTTLIGTDTVAGGLASLDVATLLPGNYQVYAAYLGDSTHLPSNSAEITQGVGSVTTTTSASVSPASPSPAGDALTVTVTVGAVGVVAPTGTVELYIDTELTARASGTLSGGTVDVPLSLNPGAHTIDVHYLPGDGFASSAKIINHTVGAFSSTLAVTASAATSTYGHTVDLTATLTSTATPVGFVDFVAVPSSGPEVALGSAPFSGSVATLSTAELPVGTIGIVASFAGSTGAAAATSSPLAHTVAKAPVVVELTSTSVGLAAGGTAALSVAVTPEAGFAGVPAGTVTITRGGTTLGTLAAGGSGSFPIGDAGTASLTATYVDSTGSFLGGSGTLDLPVAKLATVTNLFSDPYRTEVYGATQLWQGSVTSGGSPVTAGTVQLWVGPTFIADAQLTAAGTYAITANRVNVTGSTPGIVTTRFVGTTNLEASDSSANHIELVVTKAASSPVLTVSPDEPGIGSTVTLTATLSNVGAGPVGSVSFYSGATLLGTGTLVDGVASFDYEIAAMTTAFHAVFAGSGNFAAGTSDAVTVTATKAAVDVELTGAASPTYGSTFALSAEITIAGGLDPDQGVDFLVDGAVVAPQVTIGSNSKATVTFCAAEAAFCPVGTIALGVTPSSIVARYQGGAYALPGESATYSYTPAGQATTTTLTSPAVVPAGSWITLSATVTATTGTPIGSVSFYSVNPTTGTETQLDTYQLLVNGTASVQVQLTEGIFWPDDEIRAVYAPSGGRHLASSDTNDIELQRFTTAVEIESVGTANANTPTTISVDMNRQAGYSGTISGDTTVTASTGESCVVYMTSYHGGECAITFTTEGVRTLTASYVGDRIYSPSTTTGPTSVTVGAPLMQFPSLVASMASTNVVAFDTVTVSWTANPAATGTVSVSAPGFTGCTALIAAGSCTGSFGIAAVTGADVELLVLYPGDAAFYADDDRLAVRVQGCIPLDVRSTTPTLGSVTYSPAPNCDGGTKYLSGTTITATATPSAGTEFVAWQKMSPSGLVDASTDLVTSFVLTDDANSGIHLGRFRVACASVTASPTGYGTLDVYPASNCTTIAGNPGYTLGTEVFAYPTGQNNPSYAENDVFYYFGSILPAGVTKAKDSSNRTYVKLTVADTTSIPVTFGPRCRTVGVALSPTAPGDLTGVQTGYNCFEPGNEGFLAGTSVTVKALSGGSSRVLQGWAVDGVLTPSLGRQSTATVVVDEKSLVLTATYVDCFALSVTLDSTQDVRYRDVGVVDRSVPANCVDGTDRYLSGTVVTLTPRVLVDEANFTGWADIQLSNKPTQKTGVVVGAERTVTVTKDETLVAGFFMAATCSRLIILGQQDLVTYPDTGCGDGYYEDFQKIAAARTGVAQSEMWQQSDRSMLTALVKPGAVLDTYISVTGDVRNCFGVPSTTAGPTTDTSAKAYGPITDKNNTCYVGGKLTVEAQQCQSVTSSPVFIVNGDESQTLFDKNALPSQLTVPDGAGGFSSAGISDFDWVESVAVRVEEGGLVADPQRSGPCTIAGNAFAPKTDIAVYGFSPVDGIGFAGWLDIDPNGIIASNPMVRTTTATEATMPTTAAFVVDCYTLVIDEGLSVVGTPPYCPGSSPSDFRFIAGTTVQIAAENQVGTRDFVGFKEGAIASTTFVDSMTGKVNTLVLMDRDKRIMADYPTATDAFGRQFIKGLKIASGISAVITAVLVSTLFPGVGLVLGFLSAGASIFNALPGGDKPAAVFDVMNPTKITDCAARWAFGNADDPSGKVSPVKIVTTAKKIYKAYNEVKTVADLRGLASTTASATTATGILGKATETLNKAKAALSNVSSKIGTTLAPLKSAAPAVLGAASVGMGLYSAGIGDITGGVDTVEQLRDTETMTGCLEDQWRITGADL